MNNIQNIRHESHFKEKKLSEEKEEKMNFEADINLNENEFEEEIINLDLKQIKNKKYKVNLENIQRKNPNLVCLPKESVEYSKSSQIIVISRKRQREENSKKILTNDTPNEIEKNKFSDSKIESLNPNKKFRIDKMINYDISNKLENLNIQESQNDTSKDIKSGIEFKNRIIKNFKESKCKLCTPHYSNENIYNNYYPLEVPDDYSSKFKHENLASKIENTRRQISECRQLKFMEKRKLLSKENLSKEFSEIKSNYKKIFGEDFKIIKENDEDKMIIVNSNPVDKREIEAFFDTNMKIKPELQIYECSNTFNESDILNFVLQKENENIVQEGELESDSDYNQDIDYDSNREDNSCNDYPDEGDDYDDEDYYNPYDNADDYGL